MHRKKTEYFRENGSSKRMSVQTDCEMLSIQAMEAYARKYHVSGNDVVELFHENQVFEKMMIQHEYLHQISFEEVLEYVEKIIMEGSKELVVYHGSCYEFENIDLNKSHNRRDFGKGFYTTPIYEQAVKWCSKFKKRGKNGIVTRYEFDENDNKALKILKFDSYSEEWLDFILNCRRGKDNTDYDMVIGGVANDKVFNTVELFFDGLIDKTEAIGRLRYEKPNLQIAFRTDKALTYLHFEGSEQL